MVLNAMQMLADIGTQNVIAIGSIVAGALVAFWIIRKIVKFVLSLVIVALIVVAAVIYCIRVGYVSRENAERLNPLNSEQVRQSVRDAGAWAGAQAKDAAKKAVSAVVDEVVRPAGKTSKPPLHSGSEL